MVGLSISMKVMPIPLAMAAAPPKTSEIFDDMDLISLAHSGARDRTRSGFRLIALLDETQNVETLDFASGIEAVHGVGFVLEDLKDGVQARQGQQFHVAAVQTHQFQRA